jgi:hypothetical protein
MHLDKTCVQWCMHFLVSRIEWIGPEENAPQSDLVRLVTKSSRLSSSWRNIMLDATRYDVIFGVI